jgi:AcrR family transcriptional regulator
MPKQKTIPDRRISRTRTTLQQALFSLLAKKEYERITVADICDAANVGRSTFYAHFTGKDDLKRSGLEHLRKHLTEIQKESLAAGDDGAPEPLRFSLALFQHARAHLPLYRALVGGRGGGISLGAIRSILADLVRREIGASTVKNAVAEIPGEVVVQYTVGAYMAVLTWWLDGGAKLPPERVDAVFRLLATKGILHSGF